jgi:hypothetical protein
MRKILIILLLAVPAFAVDREGQDNNTIVSELVTRVYDEGFHFASQAQVIKWADTSFVIRSLNSAHEETAKKYYIARDTVILTVSGTERYALPSDFHLLPYENPGYGVTHIKANTGKEVGLKPKTVNDIDMYNTADQPTVYNIRKQEIYVEPVTQSNDSILVYYCARSSVLSALTDTLNLDRDYLDYMIYMTMEKIYRSILFRGGGQAWAEKQLANFAILRQAEAGRLAIRQQSILEPLAK